MTIADQTCPARQAHPPWQPLTVDQGGPRLDDIESAELVVRCQAGEESAMRDIYLRYFDAIYAYTRSALRNRHEAEDVTQQVFVRAFRALPRYEARSPASFRAWLFRIARNAVVDSIRKGRRVLLEEPARMALRGDTGEDDQWESAIPFGEVGGISVMLTNLPAAQREALALRFVLDLSLEEVAKAVGRTPDAVRQLQSRGLRTLKSRLSASPDEASPLHPSVPRGRLLAPGTVDSAATVLQGRGAEY